MINIVELPNGNLEMSLSGENDIDSISHIRKVTSSELEAESIFISEYLNTSNTSNCKDYEQVDPAEVGALTSAPIISDGEDVYGYMDYQIRNFLEELAAGNTITWHLG